MADDPSSIDRDLISEEDFFRAQAEYAARLASLQPVIDHIQRIGEENRESWGSLLEQNAEKFPDSIAVKSAEGNLTYREYNEQVNRYAGYLISRGLKKGDTAVVFLENRPELLIVYCAIAKIGAASSMMNTNLRSDALLHCMTLNPGAAFIVGEEVIDAFEEIRPRLALGEDRNVYFVRDTGEAPMPAGCIDLIESAADFPSSNPPTTAEVKPADSVSYVFTSGTTGGMPKAAVITHRRVVTSAYLNGIVVMDMGPDDTIYVPLPFFHTNALALSWPAAFGSGAAVALRRKFSASKFWDDVREFHATAFCYVGELCRYLMNQPTKPDDADNPLVKVIGNGLRPDIWKDFKGRFGIERVFEIYGAAESNLYFVNLLNLDCTVGMCYTPHAIVKYDVEADGPIRNADGFMERIEVGETGLALGEINESSPFAGYTNDEATEAKIFRDVFAKGDAWFNSGDLLRDIGYGHAQFVDRLGDTFRWKGENVSSTEVEKVADTFPGIRLSMVYGVVMPGGDGRAGMAAIVSDAVPESFDFKGLAEHFRQALPSYATPKFIRFRTEFESTATHKFKKFESKKEGFDPTAIADPLFVLLPGESEYRPLDEALYEEIMDNKYRF